MNEWINNLCLIWSSPACSTVEIVSTIAWGCSFPSKALTNSWYFLGSFNSWASSNSQVDSISIGIFDNETIISNWSNCSISWLRGQTTIQAWEWCSSFTSNRWISEFSSPDLWEWINYLESVILTRSKWWSTNWLSISILNILSESFSFNNIDNNATSGNSFNFTSTIAIVVFSVDLALDLWNRVVKIVD